MLKRLILFFLIGLLLSSCMNLIPMTHKRLINPYPTIHVFNLPIDSLRELILENFTVAKQYDSKVYNNLIFYYYVDILGKKSKMLVTFKTETSKDTLFSKDFFSTTGTDKDIYLHSFGQYWYSPIYYALGKPLEFRAKFRLRLKQLNKSQTQLIVEIEEPIVIKGIGGLGPDGFYSKEINVKSTTIEEYCLIYYLANLIGDKTLQTLDLEENVK